jgi:HK97 family phage major capsid protein
MPNPDKGATDPIERVDKTLQNIESTVATLTKKTETIDEIKKLVDDNVRSLEEWKQKNAARPERFNIGGQHTKRQFSISRVSAVALKRHMGMSIDNAWTDAKAEFERDTLRQFEDEHGLRVMTNANDPAGGFLVPEGVLGFGEMLRARTVIFKLGAEEIQTNVNPLNWNRQSAGSTVSYTAEGVAPTATDLTLQQVALTPKSAKALVRCSRELVERGDPAVDSIVRSDLIKQLAINLDTQALRGNSIAGAPIGITQTASVGTDTTAATSATALAILIRTVKAANGIVEGRLGWAMHPVMEQRIMALGTSLTAGGNMFQNPNLGFASETLTLMGAPYATTTILAAANGTANQAQIMFGDWSQLAIVRWKPGIEIRFSFERYFDTNEVGILGIDAHDVLVKNAASFAFNNSLTS